MTATSAFVTSLLTSFGIFCGLVLAFSILSKWKINHHIYYSSRILADLGPSPSAGSRNPFTWIKEAVMTPQEELVRIAGLDAAIYLNFFVAGECAIVAPHAVDLNLQIPSTFACTHNFCSSHSGKLLLRFGFFLSLRNPGRRQG